MRAETLDSQCSARVFDIVQNIAALPDVRAAVEANHDNNQWWPISIVDPRTRMLVAGWSTRISYSMIEIYARVVAKTDALGFERVAALDDWELEHLIRPIGLPVARIGYLRSLESFIARWQDDIINADVDSIIQRFAAQVHHASFNIAQCAVLNARGYHCGIIPVDSGMVTKLGPALGVTLPPGPAAHEALRILLQRCVSDRAHDYRQLIERNGYQISIPAAAEPTWWIHLVLIYFKRLHLNRPSPNLCVRRPICVDVMGCSHAQQ